MAQKRKSGFQISYVTITYRSVFLGILGLVALALVVMYFAFPESTNRLIALAESGLNKALVKIGLSSGVSGGTEPGPQQAHFTNIDGTVKVKKASSNTWIQADYNVALEKNDVVQTSQEGIAKVVFTDGSNYTVKPDSLIVIQENYLDASQQTQVAVQVNTGTVDLATANLSPGSKSQVSVAGAVASIASDSSAQVMNDPHTDEHSIMLKRGSGEISRGSQTVKMAENDNVSFGVDSKEMVKTREIGPPVLINPATPQISLNPNDKGVTFSWSQVDNVRGYHVSISKNQFFNSLVFDKIVTVDELVLKIPEGAYYWRVRSVGESGKESVESQAKFTLVPKGASSLTIPLEVSQFVQHGHALEVRGKTEPGAHVMINGWEAVMKADGTFYHFTNTLPVGDNVITVTVQDSKGGFNHESRTVTIQ